MDAESKDFLLKNIPGLTEPDLERLSPDIKFRKVSSGDILIESDEISKKVFFIKSGIVRIYCLSDNGVDKTILFHTKKSFVGNYDGIIFGRPSKYCYQAIGKTELFELTYDSIYKNAQKSITLNNLRGNMFLAMMGIFLKQIEDYVLLNPEERYQKHMEENPSVMNKIPSKYLASLLGITPVSLSRIKKRIFRGN